MLLLTGCGENEEPPAEVETEAVSESRVVLEDGFWRDESLPEPITETVLQLPAPEDGGELATANLQILSLDSDGEFLRLVMAWLPPEEGIPLGSIVLSSHQHRYDATPFIRLVDRDSGEFIEPLRGESNIFSHEEPPDVTETAGQGETVAEPASRDNDQDAPEQSGPTEDSFNDDDDEIPGRGTCICSLLSGAGTEGQDRTELIFVDFPAPETDTVDVVPGEWAEPISDVPISADEPFERPDPDSSWFFTQAAGEDPPNMYGAGAEYAVRYPTAARTETLSGMTTTIEEETQAVSLPSDVLFEFGSAELSSEADDIIESAAEKLNEEAQGFTVTVEGHTDNVGSAELNQGLSEDRAASVADVIEDFLDDSISLETAGYGFSQPQVPNMDADGEPIEENQAQNRRVSFRYPVVVQEEGIEIDLGGAGIEDLPEAREVSAEEGAEASFVLEAPEGDTSETDVRFDVLEADRDGDVVTMRFAIASDRGLSHRGTVFSGNPELGGQQHFGHNPQGDGDSPGLANMSLIEVETEQRYFPLASGGQGCLCTEVAGTRETLPEEPSPMFAQFQLPDELQEPVLVHLPDAGQFALPENVLSQLTAGDEPGSQD